MDKTEIVSSRMKAFSLFILGLVFLFGGVLGREEIGDGWFWFGQVFFGLCEVAALWGIIRPHRLWLDDEGFTLSGEFHWSPRSVAWHDVEEFATIYGPNCTTMIGIKFRADFTRAGLARWVGATDAIPSGWQQSNEEMVSYLNVCRIIAMNRRAKPD